MVSSSSFFGELFVEMLVVGAVLIEQYGTDIGGVSERQLFATSLAVGLERRSAVVCFSSTSASDSDEELRTNGRTLRPIILLLLNREKSRLPSALEDERVEATDLN